MLTIIDYLNFFNSKSSGFDHNLESIQTAVSISIKFSVRNINPSEGLVGQI